MPRTPAGPTPRVITKTLRMTRATAETAEAQRGDLTFSEYVRRLIIADGRRSKNLRKET